MSPMSPMSPISPTSLASQVSRVSQISSTFQASLQSSVSPQKSDEGSTSTFNSGTTTANVTTSSGQSERTSTAEFTALNKSFPFHAGDLAGLDQTKIRIDPITNMVYFDTSPSRRAFSMLRTYAPDYPTSPLELARKRRAKKRRRNAAQWSGESLIQRPLPSVLRNPVNINGEKEKERVSMLGQVAEVVGMEKYPGGSKRSVRELYAEMRKAQVEEYEMEWGAEDDIKSRNGMEWEKE